MKYLRIAFWVVLNLAVAIYLRIRIVESDIKSVFQYKLPETTVVKLLGSPSRVNVTDDEKCGKNTRVLTFSFYITAFKLRFEDSVVVAFSENGEKCFVDRTSI